MQDSLRLTFRAKWVPMRCTEILKTSVSPEMKLQAKVVAGRFFLSEATWLKRLVIREIRAHNDASDAENVLLRSESISGPTRVTPGKNGAGNRCWCASRPKTGCSSTPGPRRAASTGDLRVCSAAFAFAQLTPPPKDELLTLKRSIAKLGSISRNINQIAKAVSGGGEVPG